MLRRVPLHIISPMNFLRKIICRLRGHDWPAWQVTECEIVLHKMDGSKEYYKVPAQARECSRCGHPDVNWDRLWPEFHEAQRRKG